MIPSAAPYSVTWNAERQVTTESPLIERAFCCLGFVLLSVGASLLAKIVNDDAGILSARGALRFFASKLAPTGVVLKNAPGHFR